MRLEVKGWKDPAAKEKKHLVVVALVATGSLQSDLSLLGLFRSQMSLKMTDPTFSSQALTINPRVRRKLQSKPRSRPSKPQETLNPKPKPHPQSPKKP